MSERSSTNDEHVIHIKRLNVDGPRSEKVRVSRLVVPPATGAARYDEAQSLVDRIIAVAENEGTTDPTRLEKNPAAVALRRLGRWKSGKGGAEKLSAKKRKERAK